MASLEKDSKLKKRMTLNDIDYFGNMKSEKMKNTRRSFY